MSVFKDGLTVNEEYADEVAEILAEYEAWITASIAKSAPIMAQMIKDGILDANGRRISTEIPVIDADACVEQQ